MACLGREVEVFEQLLALYTTAAKALLNQGVPATAAMAVTLSLGAALLAPVLLVRGAELTGPRPVAMLAWLGLVATAGTYLLFAHGLTRLPAATVATLNLAEPLIAAILGLLVLGERPGTRAAVGALSLLTGLVLAARRPPRKQRPAVERTPPSKANLDVARARTSASFLSAEARWP